MISCMTIRAHRPFTPNKLEKVSLSFSIVALGCGGVVIGIFVVTMLSAVFVTCRGGGKW